MPSSSRALNERSRNASSRTARQADVKSTVATHAPLSEGSQFGPQKKHSFIARDRASLASPWFATFSSLGARFRNSSNNRLISPRGAK